jgi:hypothetical protein
MQVLQGRWDRTFSNHSYGFRPGRSAHQAVEQAQQYIAAGYRWCVDLDLVSRPNRKFRFEPSRKFLLTTARLKDGTNRDEPRGTR